MKPINRSVNQILWYAVMRYKDDVYGYDIPYENDTFVVKLYDWNNEDNNEWHFWHKPSGLKLYWYKYPLRSVEANMDITNEQLLDVLIDCINSVNKDKGIKIKTENCRWWEE